MQCVGAVLQVFAERRTAAVENRSAQELESRPSAWPPTLPVELGAANIYLIPPKERDDVRSAQKVPLERALGDHDTKVTKCDPAPV